MGFIEVEFQGRGALHMQVLFWDRDMEYRLRLDMRIGYAPWMLPRSLVYRLQGTSFVVVHRQGLQGMKAIIVVCSGRLV